MNVLVEMQSVLFSSLPARSSATELNNRVTAVAYGLVVTLPAPGRPCALSGKRMGDSQPSDLCCGSHCVVQHRVQRSELEHNQSCQALYPEW